MYRINIKIKTIQILAVNLLIVLSLGVILPVLRPMSVSAAASQLRITELMYDPSGTGDREFVEIYNGGDVSANLSGMSMVGVDYTYATGITLAPGQYGVIVRNLAAFRASNPSARVFGQYIGKLQGGGESVRIMSGGVAISQVDYLFGGAWPSTPKNGGPSLSLIRSNADEALAACWAPSAGVGGTPGAANTVDGSWSSAHAGGCSNKAYPTTATAPAATQTQQAAAAQQQAAARAQQQVAAEQAKKQEEQKAQLEKQAKAEAAVLKKAQAQVAQENAKKAQQSKLLLILAVAGSTLILGTGVGLVLFKKLRHKRRFKEVVKEQERKQKGPKLHEKTT